MQSQNLQLQVWSSLNTVTKFDAGSTLVVGMEDERIELQEVSHFSPVSLLIQSLVDQLCKLLATNPRQQKKIYEVICSKLHQMKLIDQSYSVEEFEFVRSHYQKALFDLLAVAKSMTSLGTGDKALVKFPQCRLESMEVLYSSRYRTEFEEVEFVARGGFGRVYKSRNKLDGMEYAVKKICVQYHNIAGFLHNLHEVKMLAKLNHPNIVSYKNAWLEHMPPNSQGSRVAESSRNCKSRSSGEDSGSIVFQKSSGDKQTVSLQESSRISSHSETSSSISVVERSRKRRGAAKPEDNGRFHTSSTFHMKEISSSVSSSEREDSNKFLNGLVHSSKEKSSVKISSRETSDETTEDSESDKAVCMYQDSRKHFLDVWNAKKRIAYESAMLYVQMQLCERTLREWLDDRNGHVPLSVDVRQSATIFQQIVQGVCYIHSQLIVHHDIKPSNIFLNSDLSQVQVGDFGLACCLQHSSDEVTLLSGYTKHKGEIGTKMYSAPEQLRGRCDSKSDLYSLGIVLFELLQPFSTDMERCKLITQLKSGSIPPELTVLAPKWAQLITRLVKPSSASRPSIDELSKMVTTLMKEYSEGAESLDSKDETIQQLLHVISQRDREIEELRRRLEILESK